MMFHNLYKTHPLVMLITKLGYQLSCWGDLLDDVFNNLILLPFVAFLWVFSLSIGVDNLKAGADNRKVGVDNKKALDLDNTLISW